MASGYQGQSDLVGVMLMPFLTLTDRLQFVTRYTLVESDMPNGVQLGTYENRVATGRGNRYDEAYVGVNYYFYGHRLKLQSGVQYADMDDRANDGGAYSGIGWTTGIRVGW
jgi:phosphate-selective porin OprO/OprP